MNRRRFAIMAAASAASFAAPGVLRSAAPRSALAVRAGAAEEIVTPESEGTFLIGPMKPSTGVHDDLYARVLVLEDSKCRVAILTVDYLGFDFAFNSVLIEAVSRAAGIPAGHVMINCSHTHSAPLTAPWGPWEKSKNKPFHRMLPLKLGEIARRACEKLEPARLLCMREPVQIGFNRRLESGGRIVMAVNPAGRVIPWVDVLDVRSEADYRMGERGGYETAPRGAAFMFESRLPLAPESEGVIREGVGRLLRGTTASRPG